MQLFKKKPTASSTLAELESYYGVKRGNQSRGLLSTALLSLATAFVVAAVLFSVFLGGRWIYRQARGNDTTKIASTTKKVTATPTPQIAKANPTVKPTAKPSPTPTSKPTPTPQVVRPVTTPMPQPVTLPNTGPDSDL